MLNNQQKKELLNISKITVENFIKKGIVLEFNILDKRLHRREGAFVTLRNNGRLRGCVGRIMPDKSLLWQVVRDMAVAAASKDNRFNPVSVGELGDLRYEVSVLSAPEPIDDWKKIELGKHGVIIKKDLRSGVFLPQVAKEAGWGLEEFLSRLCQQKAGLAPDCFQNDSNAKLFIFTAQVF